MRKNRMQGRIVLLSAGLILGLGLEGSVASAAMVAGDNNQILKTAGVASILEATFTEEEYIAFAEASKGASWGYTNLGIANVESGNLNVRAIPSTGGKLVGKMRAGAACEVIETAEGWAHIKSGEVEGYVSEEYLLIGPAAKLKASELAKCLAIAQTDALNVRKEANTESEVLTQVLKGEELEVIEDQGEWIKVSLDSDEAYVKAEYVEVQEKLETAITMTELLYGEGVSDVRVELVEYAKQFLGNPYVWGGTSLTKGADCSGFTLSVYKKFGVKLPHYSVSQSKMGKKISTSELQPGDLVFYSKNGTINHVAIYIGNGQVIHASSPKSGIKISKYNYRTPAKCISLLND